MPEMSLDDHNLFRLTNGSNEVTIHRHGATVISWKVDGQEKLFLSSQAHLDGSKPIRGGIPLVFPQFGTGPIMAGQHGFARTLPWDIQVDGVEAICQLQSSPGTKALWPFDFKVTYTVDLQPSELTTALTVNNTGDAEFEFTALLHTYLRVDHIGQVKVSGLNGLTYADKLLNGAEKSEKRMCVNFDQEVDRNYFDVPAEIVVQEQNNAKIKLHMKGFPDLVVWNPWVAKSKAMADFGDEEYKEMICLEAGRVRKTIKLPAGELWSAGQTLMAL